MLFSATLPEKIVELASLYMKFDRRSIRMEPSEKIRPKFYILIFRWKKRLRKTIIDLLVIENPDACIIFVTPKML